MRLRRTFGTTLSLTALGCALSGPVPLRADDELDLLLKLGAGLIMMNEQQKQQQTAPQTSGRTATTASSRPRVSADPQVREAQTFLNELGFPAGPADGLMGNKTRSAITEFRTVFGIEGGTTVDDGLLTALHQASEGELQPGARISGGTAGTDGLVEVDGFSSFVQPLQPAFAVDGRGQLQEGSTEMGATSDVTAFTSAIQPLQPAIGAVTPETTDLATATEQTPPPPSTGRSAGFNSAIQPLQPFVATPGQALAPEPEEPAEVAEAVPAKPVEAARTIPLFDIVGADLAMSFDAAVIHFETRANDWMDYPFLKSGDMGWFKLSPSSSKGVILLKGSKGELQAISRSVTYQGLTLADLEAALIDKYGPPNTQHSNEMQGNTYVWMPDGAACQVNWVNLLDELALPHDPEINVPFPRSENSPDTCSEFVGAQTTMSEDGAGLLVWVTKPSELTPTAAKAKVEL